MNRAFFRILGNFGISFFSPLIGINLGNTIFNMTIPLIELMIISAIAATFTTGLAISKEAVEYGRKKSTH